MKFYSITSLFIFARLNHHLVVFISLCGFYISHVSYLFSSFCFRFMNASSHVDSSSSFSFIRAYFIHILPFSSLYFSASSCSLLLTRFSISFSSLFHSTWRHFCPHTPRLVTSLFFSLAIPALCARPAESSFFFISVAFIFPSHSTLTSLFVHSASFAPSLPLLYLFPGVLPASCAARPRLRYLSRFSTHVNARSLIFLGSLFLAFVPPSRASAPRYPLRDIFRFPFRYVRSVSDTWSVLPCLDIVLFCRAKCILLASPVFAPFFFPPFPSRLLYAPLPYFSSNSWHFVTSPDGRSSKIRYARFPPITRVNSGTQLESGEPQDRRDLANGYGRCSLERESPVKQYSTKFL